jgi:hypothetical protein
MVLEATTPQGAEVHFDAPAPTGGKAPYTVECEPGSGSVFPIGESTVRCTAKDADMAQASCEFPVSVRVSQMIAKTKFSAFGDSITEGAVSLAPMVMLAGLKPTRSSWSRCSCNGTRRSRLSSVMTDLGAKPLREAPFAAFCIE